MNQLVELSIQLATVELEGTKTHKFCTILRDSLIESYGFSLNVANSIIGSIEVSLNDYEISNLDLTVSAQNFAQFINNLRLYCTKHFDMTTFWNKIKELKIEAS